MKELSKVVNSHAMKKYAREAESEHLRVMDDMRGPRSVLTVYVLYDMVICKGTLNATIKRVRP